MYKVLFITQLPPPIHGASLVNQHIKESSLINKEFDCKYINLTTTKTIKDLGRHAINKYITSYFIYINLIKSFFKINYDLCYVTMAPHGLALLKDSLVIFICKLFGRKVVIHLHGKGIREEARNVFKNFFYRLLLQDTDVICLSPLLIGDIAPVFNKSPYVLANGLPDYATDYAKTYRSQKTINILFLSNLIASKGILTLIDALKILHDKNLDFSCRIVGDEGDVSFIEVRDQIYSYGLQDKLTICGAKYGEDKTYELQHTDIFIHPTINDAFPLVLLEAMMFGLPVVSTFEGAIPEIVDDNVTGYLCQQNNPAELAEKIKSFMVHPDLLARFGKAARQKYLGHYQLEKFESNFIQILKQIAEK